MAFDYQVEFTDDAGREHVLPFGSRKSAAISKARRVSNSDDAMVAYVVATDPRGRSCGHKAFSVGSVIETDGEGF